MKRSSGQATRRQVRKAQTGIAAHAVNRGGPASFAAFLMFQDRRHGSHSHGRRRLVVALAYCQIRRQGPKKGSLKFPLAARVS